MICQAAAADSAASAGDMGSGGTDHGDKESYGDMGYGGMDVGGKDFIKYMGCGGMDHGGKKSYGNMGYGDMDNGGKDSINDMGCGGMDRGGKESNNDMGYGGKGYDGNNSSNGMDHGDEMDMAIKKLEEVQEQLYKDAVEFRVAEVRLEATKQALEAALHAQEELQKGKRPLGS